MTLKFEKSAPRIRTNRDRKCTKTLFLHPDLLLLFLLQMLVEVVAERKRVHPRIEALGQFVLRRRRPQGVHLHQILNIYLHLQQGACVSWCRQLRQSENLKHCQESGPQFSLISATRAHLVKRQRLMTLSFTRRVLLLLQACYRRKHYEVSIYSLELCILL